MLQSSRSRLLMRIICHPTPEPRSISSRARSARAASKSPKTVGFSLVTACTGACAFTASAIRASTASALSPASFRPGLFLPDPTHR